MPGEGNIRNEFHPETILTAGGGVPGQEERLTGGNMSEVVRVGGTVRRKQGPWTPTIQRLLAHVRAKGVLWVPEPLGIDEAGREVLTYIPGEVPHEMPAWVWKEAVLTDVARALRSWHDATADFPEGNDTWGLPASGPREVICHHDFAPYNCVFRNGRFVGAFDYDLCAPGTRLWDLAYTAYRYVPLMPGPDSEPGAFKGEKSPFDAVVMAARLESFLSSYGPVGGRAVYGQPDLLPVVFRRLHAIADWTEEYVRTHKALALAEHAAMYRSHADWIASLMRPDNLRS